MLATAGPSALWYLTRGTGLVALLLLTASVALGVLEVSRWRTQGWPRFVTAGLHRNISLLVMVVLAIHIVTAELDTFAPVGWLALAVPFASAYRPIWLGLGTLAFDLLLALVVTSVVRTRIGYRTWRAIHWAAYGCWPLALVHGLGTGTDPRLGWVRLVSIGCAAVVLTAVAWRLAHRAGERPGVRIAGATAVVVASVVIGAWAVTGPLRPGWARRAGTPSALLASSTAASRSPATTPAPSSAAPTAPAVPLPFSASLNGNLSQSGPDPSGQVTITIRADVSGGVSGTIDMVLKGRASGEGVELQSSNVTFGPATTPTAYQGQVIALNGNDVVASVRASSGQAITLGASLVIDPSSGAVHGTLTGQRGTGHSASEGGGGP